MSDTKFEKSEELISRLDIDPEKFTPNSSQCSCLNCDSIGCFTKRNKAIKARCKCNICSELKPCPSINTKDSRETKAELVAATKKIVREVVTRETVESLKRVTETMYEFGNKENVSMLMEGQTILSNKKVIPMPANDQTAIKGCCKKSVFGSRQTSDTNKCKQNLTSESVNIKKGHSDQSTRSQGHISDKKEISKKKVFPNSNIRESKECCKQNVIPQNCKLDRPNTQSPISLKHVGDKKECCKETPITKVSSKDIRQPDKVDDTANKLSAQVMNVPYEDINESTRSSRELIHDSVENPLTKLNIFKRIKEIYEACSCKVCECISNKPRIGKNTCDFRIDGQCKCKPCECKECVKLRKNIEEKIKRIPHSGCPCIRCDRTDCRGLVKKQVCDCNPSNSTQYLEDLSKPCSCEPCQCITCTSIDYHVPKVVKLGQVYEITHGETCKCSPCECIECRHIYNVTNPTIMCTTSTAMPHRNYCPCDNCHTARCRDGDQETCKCGKHDKTMRKSFEKNCNDYDIRTVILDNNSPFNKHKQSPFGQQNTIALLTPFKNSYGRNLCNESICNCSQCECVICPARDSTLKSREHLRPIMSVQNNMKLPMPIMDACRCSPCECEVCYKKGKRTDDVALESNCKCEVCDCLNCDNAPLANSAFPTSTLPTTSVTPYNLSKAEHTKTIRRMDTNKNCDCNPCNCRDCKKLFSCSSTVKFYSNGKIVQKQTSRRVRKVMLITPSSSETHIKLQNPSMASISSKNLRPKASEGMFQHDLSTCHALSNNYATMNKLSKTNKHQDSHSYEDIKECNILSDNDVETDMFYNLSNSVLETASFKSVGEASLLNYPCDLPQASFEDKNVTNNSQHYKNKAKCNKFDVIHEPLGNISSKYSDESLPVFWTCHNEMSFPINPARNIKITCKRDKCRSKELSSSLNNSKDSEQLIQSRYDGKYNYNHDVELKESAKSIIYQSVQPSAINIDYERAVRVLAEAKAFSSKLIQMLDSFETANKQFESASQKFKDLHESLLDINDSGVKQIYSTEIEVDLKPIIKENFGIKSEDDHTANTFADVRVKDENQAEKEYEQSTAILPKTNDILEFIPEKFENLKPDINMIAKTNLNSLHTEVNAVSTNDLSIQKESNLLQKSLDLPINKSVESLSHKECPPFSDFNKLDIIQDLFNKKANNEINNKSNTTVIKKASVKTKLDSVFGNTSNIHRHVVIEKRMEDLSKHGDNQPWRIFSKNLYLNPHPINKRPIFELPPLQLDVKKAIQAISSQAGNNENFTRIVPRSNEALANLKSEVSNLLNMPLLQTSSTNQREADPFKYFSSRSKIVLEPKSTSFASSQTYEPTIVRADKAVYSNITVEEKKSSWDQLKVNFVDLRRVSDHTVLVKWDVPKRIEDVQGYELLVDGRAVQAFGASRRMAVVTCLPHAARVLLTVRTLPVPRCARAHRHAPAATVVYRPRK